MINRAALTLGLIINGIWTFSIPWFEPIPDQTISILSHRGVYQTFAQEGVVSGK